MIKKIVSYLVLLVFIFSSSLEISVAQGNDNVSHIKEVIIAKHSLKKAVGNKYVSKIDEVVEKLKNNKSKLELLSTRINEIQKKLESKTDSKSKKILAIVNYLEAKINLELHNSKGNEVTSGDEENLEEAEKEILEIQKYFHDEIIKKINLFEENIQGNYDYEERGNFSLDFDMSHDSFGEYKAGFKLEDYISQVSKQDSKTSSNIEAYMSSSSNGQEMKVNISSFIDVVIKDGEIFLKLDNFETQEENAEMLSYYLESIKKIAEQNGYVRFKDSYSENIATINKQTIETELENIFSKPLFKAYKKTGNKYYLVPTLHACSSAKEIAKKFDPFNGINCSESQYEKFVSDFKKAGDLTMSLSNENKNISFEGNLDIDTKTSISIDYNESGIEKIVSYILPNQVKYPDELFALVYEKEKFLNAKLIAEGGDTNIRFDSKLDNSNSFESFSLEYYISDYEEIKGNLSMSNGEIKGNMDMVSYEGETIFSVEHSGELEENYLKIDSKYQTQDPLSKETISGDINFELGFEEEAYVLKFLMDAYQEDKKILNIEIDYDGEVESKDIKIEKPNNYIDSEEIFPESNYDEYYYQ